jgi:hypothetical protein
MKAIFPLVLLALVLGPGPASGNPAVYHSSDGADPGKPKRLSPGSEDESIKLYINAGSNASVISPAIKFCKNADGDELCGIDVVVKFFGDGQFTSFAGNEGVVHYLHYPGEPDVASPTSVLRLNVLQAIDPPSPPLPQPLGTLNLETGTKGCRVEAEGEVVGADGELKTIPKGTIIASCAAILQCDVLDGDSDSDGVGNDCDSCVLLANADQTDSDHDGFGNACDGDFNQDGACGNPDFTVFMGCFNKKTGSGVGPPHDPDCEESDMNGDGAVGNPDFTLFMKCFNDYPGPSGHPCAGTGVACP